MLAGLTSFIFGSENSGSTAPTPNTVISGNDTSGQTNVPAPAPAPRPKTYNRRRRRPASMSSPAVGRHTRFGDSIAALYEESGPIVISDNEDQKQPRYTTKQDLVSSIARSSGNPLRQDQPTATRGSKEHKLRDEEQRLMGGLRRREVDEVTIVDPMARGLQQPKPGGGGFRPLNTLDAGLGQSPRSRLQNQVTHRSSFEKPGPVVRENNHIEPNKRRRVHSSPAHSTDATNPIRIDDSQEAKDERAANPLDSPSQLAEGDLNRSSEGYVGSWPANHIQNPKNKQQTSSSTERAASKPGLSSPSQSHASKNNKLAQKNQKSVPPRLRKHSTPEDNGHKMNVTTPSAYKSAKANVIHSPTVATQDRARELSRMLPSSSTISAASDEASASHKARTRRVEQNDAKRRTIDGDSSAKVQQRYGDESPDALQSDDTYSKRHGRNMKNPLPADLIQGNHNSTKINRWIVMDNRRCTKLTSYSLRDASFPTQLIAGVNYVVEINHGTKTFAVEIDDPTIPQPFMTPIALCRVNKLVNGESGSNLVEIQLQKTPDFPQKIMLRLEDHDLVHQLCELVTELDGSIKRMTKQDEQMEGTLHKLLETQSKQSMDKKSQRSLPQTTHSGTTSKYFRKSPMAQRLHEAELPEVYNKQKPSEQSKHELLNQSQVKGDLRDNADSGKTIMPASDWSHEIKTRSHAEKTSETKSLSKPTFKFSQTGALGRKWKGPLTYPKEGKKREAVDFADLARLDEDEYLNDNLINFFQRYLQHQMEQTEPEMLKKLHFFSTYFYTTLNQNVKGRRGVNYNAVEKWTKSVDIFKRDFVVVPVNESYHWFLAIVCNLSYFDKQQTLQEPEESDVDVDVQQLDQPCEEEEEAVKDSTIQMSGIENDNTNQTQQSFQGLSLDDDHAKDMFELPRSSDRDPTPSGSRGRKKKVRQLPKYESHLPIIITFDSLGQARTAAITALRQYIIQEGKAKRNLDIDGRDIKGMTAKGIPNQPNFSDCGLYACMYLEQFMVDPYGFVNRQLQREELNYGWPKSIHSDDLRTRYRNMILEIYRKQHDKPAEHPIPEVGKILTDIRPKVPVFDLDVTTSPRKERTREEVRVGKAKFDQLHQLRRRNTSPSSKIIHTTSAATDHGPRSDETIATTGTATCPEKDLVVNDAKPETRQSHRSKRRSFSQHSPVHHSPISHSNPTELAESMRRRRSPQRYAQHEQQERGDDQRRYQRSDSVSTERLTGLHTYFTPSPERNRSKSRSKMPGSFDHEAESAAHGGKEANDEDDGAVDDANGAESQDLSSGLRDEIPETQQQQQQELDGHGYQDGRGRGDDDEDEDDMLMNQIE